MKNYFLLFLGFISISLLSCSSDDDNGEQTSTEDANILVVYLEGTGSSGIDVQWGSETFCYDDGGCSTSTGMSFTSTFGDSRIDMATSNLSKVSTGVRIPSIQINSGSGTIQVVKSIYKSVDGFDEYEDVEIVFTSPVLSSGDTYTLEYGEYE